MPAIDRLLQLMLEKDGSDLHLNVGQPPKARISGNVIPIEDGMVTAKQMETYLSEICPERRWNEFLETKDLDLAHEIPGVARFRGNYLYNHWGQAGIFRQIPAEILSFETLNLPEVLKKFCHMTEGLVVVTGPTGSGKSTTLAAMIDYINNNLARHIITIEDPIEFVHPNKKSVIVHREVGEHTESFGDALKGAMRHTNNAPKTVDRIINTFPAEEQNQVRVMLAGCLSGVVAQLLCKRQPKGRVAVHEILLKHEALPNTIRSGAIANIRAIIESGKNEGMTTMDWSLMDRVKDGSITAKEAFMKSASKQTFQHLLKPGDLDDDGH